MWGVRSFAKVVACLCLVLALWSAVAVVAHHHSNSSHSLKCPVCVAARTAAAATIASKPQPIFVRLSSVALQTHSAKYRLTVFALSVRPPPIV